MTRFLKGTLWLIAGFILAAPAMAAGAPKYLILVEHSPEMARRQAATERTIADLVRTGFHARIQAGEEFSVWFYNQTLQTNLSLAWRAADAESLAARAVALFQARTPRTSLKLEHALGALATVIEQSPDLSLFIFTDGVQPIAGTGFDAGLNKATTDFRQRFADAAKPFLITLLARDGEFAGAGIHTALGVAVELPNLPPREVVAAKPVEPVVEPKKADTPKTEPPPKVEDVKPKAAEQPPAQPAVVVQPPPQPPPVVAVEKPVEKPEPKPVAAPPIETPARLAPAEVTKVEEPAKPIEQMVAQVPQPAPPLEAAVPAKPAPAPVKSPAARETPVTNVPVGTQAVAIPAFKPKEFPWPYLLISIAVISLAGLYAYSKLKAPTRARGSVISQSLGNVGAPKTLRVIIRKEEK